MSTKVFCLFFVLCFALGSLAQLDPADQVAVYDQITLPTTVGTNITGWLNSAPGAAGAGDLILGAGAVSIQQCGPLTTGATFDGSSFLSTTFPTPVTITSTQTVVVVAVVKSDVSLNGRQGVISTTNEANVPWSEGSVGPGIFTSGLDFYEDAEFATTSNVAGTTGLSGGIASLGFVYQPDVADTSMDYVVINGPTVQFFSGSTTAQVQTAGAFTQVNVGFRNAGTNTNQHLTGCINYLAIYVVDTPIEPVDVALSLVALSNRFGTAGSTPGNSTTVPSVSPQARTTGRSTTRRATTTGRRATTTGRRSKTSTTGVSAASLPFVAPAIQAVFVVFVSLFLFYMS
jgi:hypothetical protein